MDELELSGRRHISTKRAGRQHGYHSDYIGQLIRGKKVAGQKVGRSWYVDEASLNEYLGKEARPVQQVQPAQPSQPVQVVVEEKIIETVEEPVAVEETIEEEKKVEIKKVKEIEIIEEERPVPLVVSAPASAHVPVRIGGLTYVADEEPLLPIVRTRRSDEALSANYAVTHEPPTPPPPRRTRSLLRVATAFVAVLFLVGVASAASIFISSVVVVEGEVASVHYSLW